MKKIILSLSILSLCTGTVFGACNGGTLTQTGGFCVSDMGMNWWSAAAWCQANGRRLPTIYEVCPDWNGNMGNGKCGRIIDTSMNFTAWTSTAYGNQSAIHVNPSTGFVDGYTRTGRYSVPVCK